MLRIEVMTSLRPDLPRDVEYILLPVYEAIIVIIEVNDFGYCFE